jgi:autotransporter-associated beta strand protein
VNLGAVGGNVNYNVASLGAVSGGSVQLQSLTIGQNFFPATGAMIAHTSFNPAIGTGNPVGLTNVPTYIFGISSNFTSAGQSIVVGSLSNSPWLGFGSDQSPHTFGGGAGQTLGISGNAQLVALGGALTVNAPITGTAADKINKNGAGLVIINSAANTFTGPLEVQTGPIAMNAGWTGPIQIDAGATLGGTGNLTSPMSFMNDPTNTFGSFFKPGNLGPIPNSAASPTTIEGPGTLHTTGNVSFSSLTHLVYDLDTANVAGGANNDLLTITGNLALGGILDINRGPDFSGGVYTLMTYTGTLTNNGLTLGNVPLDDFPGMQIVIQSNPGGGGSVLLAVPEPATLGLAALGGLMLVGRRLKRRWGLTGVARGIQRRHAPPGAMGVQIGVDRI